MGAISDEISFLVVADMLQGSRNVKDGCRQDTGTQKPDLVEPESRSKLLKADSQANQEMMSNRDEEHMMVPTQPTTHLLMVKADFAFGFFEDGLNWPAHAIDPHELAQGRVSRGVAEVVFDQTGLSRLRRMISQSSPANLKEAFAFANQVDAGVVKINEPTTGLALNAPFGGFKQSSANTFKEQGQVAMDFYTRTKTIYMNHG